MGMKDDEGIFKVLFLGDFNTGKSAIINALIGDEILPTCVLPNVAVIRKVLYGMDTENIKIFKNGSDSAEVMPLERFEEEYKLTDEDIVKIEETGSFDRLRDVDYVALESEHDLFQEGFQFIDTPGLAEAFSRVKAANIFIPQADAVVFVLSAACPFSRLEKQYIEKYFVHAEPKPRNVFFVINRINQLVDDDVRDAIRRQCKRMLTPVFTIDGVFDENLYNSRVFFVNADGAFQMRKEGREPVGTGIMEFQAALEELRKGTAGYKIQLENNSENPDKKGENERWELKILKRRRTKYKRR